MLQATLRRAATLVIALATLAGCDAQPLAPHAATPALAPAATAASSPNIYRYDATVPFAFDVHSSCANDGQGEELWATGELRYRGHWITSTIGQKVHYAEVVTFTGSAVGEESGEVYDIVTRELSEGNFADGTDGPHPGEERQRMRLELTSRATGAVIRMVLEGRYVQTGTGEFVIYGSDATERCG